MQIYHRFIEISCGRVDAATRRRCNRWRSVQRALKWKGMSDLFANDPSDV
jgi:hypothetical protein